MKQLKVRIIDNRRLAQDFYRVRLESSFLAKNIRPGQFVNIRCSDGLVPLLRRPFSVHRIVRNGIELLYEVVGRGTELLSRKVKGETIDVIGPLGNGFKLNAIRYPLNAILIAGGMGVAPLLAVAEEIAYSVERVAYSEKVRPYAIIGAKTKGHIFCEKDFKKLGFTTLITTEDGSKGKKGLATDLLKDVLTTNNKQLTTIYACGPNAMLKEVAKIAKAKNISCQVSLEEYMACGVGVCLGCPVKLNTQYAIRNTQYEYKMVCRDGPIFDAEEIFW